MVNPTVTFPPATAHDGDDIKPDGEEESTQVVSVGNPELWPETTVPTGPETGVSTKLLVGPAFTMNVAVAVSSTFVLVETV